MVYSSLMAKKRIGICVAVLSVPVLLATPAHADPGSEFLELVAATGLDVGPSITDRLFALATAESLCDLFHYGFTADDARDNIVYKYPNATPQQLAGFVSAAQSKLCAQAYAVPSAP